MSRWVNILLIAFVVWVLPCGCIRDYYLCPCDEEVRYIRMSFSAGQIRPAVKSADGHQGHPQESAFHQIQVWVFNSGIDEPSVAYKEVSGEELARLTDKYGEITLTMPVDRSRLTGGKQLDIYVAANVGGAGLVLPARSKPSELDAVVLHRFSPSEAVGAVPSGGLPISRVVKGVDGMQYLSTARSAAPPLKIPLVRAVSKIKFYMVRPVGLDASTVERIVLDGNSIGREEYFFPEPVAFSASIPDPQQARIRPGGGYHSTPIQLMPQDTDIYSHPDPEYLRRSATETVEDYVTRVHAARVAPFGVTYLKESDRAITGTVYYRMGVSGPVVREEHFRLDPGLFIRNHEWIVYVYFSKDRLYVCPEIAPWTDAGEFAFDWNYTYTLTNRTGAAQTRILEKDGDDFVMCAWGTGTDGLPYSPKLQLEGQSSIPSASQMRLVLDNADFGFVEDDGGVLSAVKDDLCLTLDTTPRSVVFYVVPRHPFDLAGPNPANPQARLKVLMTSQGLASIRLPFNVTGLPGDTETIRYHYVTPDQFR